VSRRTLAELERHAELMEMLSQVSRVALEEDEDLPRVLHRIVFYISARMPVGVAGILLLDESGRNFVLEVTEGALALEPLGEGDTWPIDRGVVGRCVRTGAAQLITDPESDPDYLIGNPLVRSEYIVPIRIRERTIGVLNLESAEPDTFTPAVCRIFDQLALQIAGAVHVSRVNQRLAAANRELERLSQRDGLTGLPNRRTFDRALAEAWHGARELARPLAVLVADLDHFKALNDAWGHLHGDLCLRQVAGELQRQVSGEGDLVARFGGEEFAVLLPGRDLRSARQLAERLRRGIAGLHLLGAAGRQVTLSIGVASVRPHGGDPAELVASADRALYRAKHAGRDRVETERARVASPAEATEGTPRAPGAAPSKASRARRPAGARPSRRSR
jgi:diguanylate cyclase (GGDEF)-like protein